MKAKLEIEIDFESWFVNAREPKTKEGWTRFFEQYLITGSILGTEKGKYTDIISLSFCSIKVIDLQ